MCVYSRLYRTSLFGQHRYILDLSIPKRLCVAIIQCRGMLFYERGMTVCFQLAHIILILCQPGAGCVVRNCSKCGGNAEICEECDTGFELSDNECSK